MMKTREELEQARLLAKDYWLNSPYTQKEIAERVGVSEQTISAWRRDGNWDSLKEGLLKIADKRFTHYLKLLDLFSEKLKAEQVDIDELTKLNALMEKISFKGTEPKDVEKVGLAMIRYLDEVMPHKRDFYIAFYRSFAEWYSQNIKAV